MDPRVDVHVEVVDAWIARAAAARSTRALLRTFETTLSAVWSTALGILGDVTMNAVADRVLANAVDRFPCFAALHPSVVGRLRCYELRLQTRLGGVAFSELVVGIRGTMIELLSLLGSLTADILTPELHAQLARLPAREHEWHRAAALGVAT
jgi:hypothetical protein